MYITKPYFDPEVFMIHYCPGLIMFTEEELTHVQEKVAKHR